MLIPHPSIKEKAKELFPGATHISSWVSIQEGNVFNYMLNVFIGENLIFEMWTDSEAKLDSMDTPS